MSIRASEFESPRMTTPTVHHLLRLAARPLGRMAARRRAAMRRRVHLRELRQLSPHLKTDIGVAGEPGAFV